MKTVSIVWEDSRQISGWKYLEELNEDVCICHSVGKLVKETSDAFFVATTTADDESQMSAIVSIPKSCVKEICEISTHSNAENERCENIEGMAERYAESCAKTNNLPEEFKHLLCSAYLAGVHRV